MEMLYHQSTHGNFGDDINELIWPNLLDFKPTATDGKKQYLFGIGSVLGDIQIPNDGTVYVCGTGVRPNGSQIKSIDVSKLHILFLRGPLSCLFLNLPIDLAVTDSAYAYFLLKDTSSCKAKRYSHSLIPHYNTINYFGGLSLLKSMCERLNIYLIDPRQNYHDVISEIAASKYIITESLHGAIFADGFRIPWKRLQLTSYALESSYVSEFKWLDWTMSMNIRMTPIVAPYVRFQKSPRKIKESVLSLMNIPSLYQKLKSVKSSDDYVLSLDSTSFEKITEIEKRVNNLRSQLLY
jgi:succinoglycan biosynthesis protein ExoV